MATQRRNVSKNYKNCQALQRDALRVATEKGWRTIEAKGDQLIIRR